jgi:hypothetical protein
VIVELRLEVQDDEDIDDGSPQGITEDAAFRLNEAIDEAGFNMVTGPVRLWR